MSKPTVQAQIMNQLNIAYLNYMVAGHSTLKANAVDLMLQK